jgi:hypothetical protein
MIIGADQHQQQQIITVEPVKIKRRKNNLLIKRACRNHNLSHRNRSLPNEEKQKEFRSWLLLLSSLAATITFTAGLTPPGGFWSADDKANGYVAGTSVICVINFP